MSSKQILFIVIATFITIALWIVFDIIHSRSQVQPPAEIQQVLEPVSPEFEVSVVE